MLQSLTLVIPDRREAAGARTTPAKRFDRELQKHIAAAIAREGVNKPPHVTSAGATGGPQQL
jgi:hypothetical protein